MLPVPGPSAVLAALAVSALPSDRFYYLGFLPRRSGERRRRLEEVARVPATLVLFEAPHRLRQTLRSDSERRRILTSLSPRRNFPAVPEVRQVPHEKGKGSVRLGQNQDNSGSVTPRLH